MNESIILLSEFSIFHLLLNQYIFADKQILFLSNFIKNVKEQNVYFENKKLLKTTNETSIELDVTNENKLYISKKLECSESSSNG